jgi:ABC-type Fe3+/spermidine/putrescine transport system ATPase subunit
MGEQSSNTLPRLANLQLVDVRKHYGTNLVLDDFSMQVPKGEICCLLGPSGCGKTTALKIIDGLIEQESGHIYLGDQDISDLPAQKRNIGMVFQNYALFPTMNVYDNVAYGLRCRKKDGILVRQEVNNILELVRLEGYQDRRIHELSGGQQQRVALARALIIEPGLLLLDEPLSNLDARLRSDMRDEINRIQNELSFTTVYVTHDQEEAMSIADSIVIMNEGRVEQVGTPKEIYEKPSTKFVADFIGKVNLLPGDIDLRGMLSLLGRTIAMPERLGSLTGRVACAIRPERIKLSSSEAAVHQAVIDDAIYLGPVVRYKVSVLTGGNNAYMISVEVPAPEAKFNNGDEVNFSVEPQDIHVFAE